MEVSKITEIIFKNKYTIGLSFAVFIFLLYGKCLSFGFSPMDEQWLIIKKESLLNSSNIIYRSFTESLAGEYYRPFFILSIAFDYKLGQLNPFYFHLSNLFYHFIFCFLSFQFLTKLSVSKKLAFMLITVFILHPVLLHSVAWIPGRNDLILGIFAMSSMIFLINYLTSKKIVSLVLHFLFFAFALLTKENAIVLPLIFLSLFIVVISFTKRQLVFSILFWLIITSFWYILRNEIVNPITISHSDLLITVKNFALVNLVYLGKVFFPFNLSVYPSLHNTNILFGLISLAIIILSYFFIGIKSKKHAFLGLFIYFILLALPIYFDSKNSGTELLEQRIYTSVIGIILFISQLKIKWSSNKIKYILVFISCIFLFKTFLRMNIYSTSIAFTEAGILEAPEYGIFYAQKGEYEFAHNNCKVSIENYLVALKLRPDKPEIYNGIANAYECIGDHKSAIENYTKALNISGFNDVVLINRCIALLAIDDVENAMLDLISLKDHNSKIVPPVLEKEIKDKWLEKEFIKLNKLIILEPKNPQHYFEIAKRYLNIENYSEALKNLEIASLINPQNEEYKSVLRQVKGVQNN